jgi:hypothetical protein
MLYAASGDGGNFNDQGAGHVAGGNAQSLGTYLGKLLRIDVDAGAPWIPAGNPFGDLIWSYGLRNPWRFSFDRQTGDLYIADVGQGAWEEIDFAPASSTGGENYGWRCMEGLHCTGLSGCTCNDAALTLPIHEYGHSPGGHCSVTGGYVYRGSAIPGLQGTYFFSDYCSGRIWSFTYDGVSVSNFTDRTAELNPPGPLTIANVTSFGEDANGELLIVDQAGGEIYRVERVCPAPTTYCVAAINSTGVGATMFSSGGGSVSDNNLVLGTTGLPPFANGLYFYGPSQQQVPNGNGFLCVGGSLLRLPVVTADDFGDVTYPFDVTAPPGVIDPGETWNFQLWYRNPAGGGAFYNFSNGLSVEWCD